VDGWMDGWMDGCMKNEGSCEPSAVNLSDECNMLLMHLQMYTLFLQC